MNNWFLVFMGVAMLVAIAALVYLKRKEGFENPIDGAVPTAAQTSSIPTDVAGSTSSNPQIALAAPKDIQAASDALNTFKLLVTQKDPTTTDLDADTIMAIQINRDMIPNIDNKLKAAFTNPDVAGSSLNEVTQLRETFATLTTKLAAAHVIKGPTQTMPAQNSDYPVNIPDMPQPTLVASPPSKITVDDLINLRERINKESLKLANLRSTSPTMLARRNQLESLAGELTDMISRLQAGTLAITDIPITKDDADNFLNQLEGTGPLPSLHLPSGTTTSKAEAETLNPQEQSMLPGLQNPQLQQLLKNAQNLKWGIQMNVSYDPEVSANERLVQRLEAIENRLTNLSTSGRTLPESVSESLIKELENLRKIANRRAFKKKTVDRFPTDYSAIDTSSETSPDVPNDENLAVAQGKGLGTQPKRFPNGERSPDIYVRPGFVMNSDSIAHRASSSSFDNSAVGGPDWQKRSLDLCKQIQGASLGDTANFGCIKNPTEVGPEYSWKGNYTMVCNRLGDTWGGWYPAMFGCPIYDPTAKFKGTSA
jgi:hypothetical protein